MESKVHYCVHNSQQLVPILIQMNPVRILPSCHFKSILKLWVPIHQCHQWHMLLLCATTQHMLAPSSASHLQGRSDIWGSIFLQNSSTLLLITQLYTPKARLKFHFTKSHTQKLCDGYIHRTRSQTFWTYSCKPLLMVVMDLKFWGHIHMKTSCHTYQHQRPQNNKISVLAQVLRPWNKGRNSSRLQKQIRKL